MGFLNRLFHDTESLSREIESDDEEIIKHWNIYLGTIPGKEKIIKSLAIGQYTEKDLERLNELLALELVDISDEDIEEKELILDLESLEHTKKIKRIQRLEHCLGYAKTKFEYVHKLLHQLYLVLKFQMHLVTKLKTQTKNADTLLSHLKQQFELEIEIVNQIKNTNIMEIDTFHELFLKLIRGEHKIKIMDKRENKLLSIMQSNFDKVISEELTEGKMFEWVSYVFNAIEDKIRELVAQDLLDQHPERDFEFVNRPEFIDLVKSSSVQLIGRNVSEQRINAFVHLFREWYNERE
ncbi:MAG: hypothetical protein NDI94_06715 [Candidatus Woesearchaeota archaeon]|nr:hypothetical protein [Candidatus Woesearchaeota archaeon]